MLDAILDNHLLTAFIVLLFLWLVPALLMRGHRLRDPAQKDRRRRARVGVERRA